MTSASKTAILANLIQRATESDQSAFAPDTPFRPQSCKRHVILNSRPFGFLDQVDGCFHQRKSVRLLDNPPIGLESALRVLNAAYGYLRNGRRTVPSAGGYYALFLHLCRIEDGMIHNVHLFDPSTCTLVESRETKLKLAEAFYVYQVDFTRASWMILWSCRLTAPATKYGAKSYRFLCIEIGHSAQMGILDCLAQGLKSIPLGGVNEHWLRTNVTLRGRRLLPQYALLF